MPRICPNCQSPRVHRAHRRGLLEKVGLLLVGMRPYRCHKCDHRFYDRRSRVESEAESPEPPAAEAAAEPPPPRRKRARKERPAPKKDASPLLWRRQCPHCGSGDVHWSRRTTSRDTLLRAIGIRPYRCHHCNARLYGFFFARWRRVSNEEAPAA